MRKFDIKLTGYGSRHPLVSAGEAKALAAVLLGLVEAASEIEEGEWADDWETEKRGQNFSTSVGGLTVSVGPVFLRAPRTS